MALPEGEEEKFIAEKAAAGTPVENMTIKQLRADVKKYKQDKEAIGYELERMQKINQSNVTRADKAEAKIQKLLVENEKLKKQPPQVIETVKTITPPNYVETVQRAEELQERVDSLLAQKEDAQKTIADLQKQIAGFEQVEKENARLQAKFDAADKLANQYHVERDILQEQLENQTPITVEPNDYQQLQNKIVALQKQIADGNQQGEPPADFQKKFNLTQKKLEATREKLDATKNELFIAQQAAENAKAELADAQKEAENAKEILSAEKYIEQLFQSAAVLINSPYYRTAFKNYMQKNSDTKDKIDGLRSLCDKFNTTCKVVEDLQKKNK